MSVISWFVDRFTDLLERAPSGVTVTKMKNTNILETVLGLNKLTFHDYMWYELQDYDGLDDVHEFMCYTSYEIEQKLRETTDLENRSELALELQDLQLALLFLDKLINKIGERKIEERAGFKIA